MPLPLTASLVRRSLSDFISSVQHLYCPLRGIGFTGSHYMTVFPMYVCVYKHTNMHVSMHFPFVTTLVL